jgi:integrase/recombinase XerC
VDIKIFKEKIKDFLTYLEVEKNASTHTIRAYQGDLGQLSKFWERVASKDNLLKEAFDPILRKFAISLFYQKISKPSLARKISALRSFQDFLKSQGEDLSVSLKSPRLDKKLPITLTVDEIFYLLDAVKIDKLPTKLPYRDKALFELIYATGVRCSEVVSIKLTDIDLENKSIKIMGKGRKERIVLFGNKAQKSLNEYIQEERSHLVLDELEMHLFLNKNGSRLTTRSVQRIFEMFRKFLKVNRKLTPHKIRHSFATHLLNEGVDLRVIQELLGHKTIATTEIYTHVSNQHLAKICNEKHPLNSLDYLVLDEKL